MPIVLPSFAGATVAPASGGGDYTVTYINTLENIRAISSATLGETAYGTDTHDLYVYDGENWTTFNND